jgi:steroid delta-isomerase-like uncharacterized protein
MSTEENKALVRRYTQEVFNAHNPDRTQEFVAGNVVSHNLPPGMPSGVEGIKQMTHMFVSAFPDLHLTIEDVIAEGDKVVERWTGTGTQQGAFAGIPPTGKRVTTTGIDIFRIANGKVVEHWSSSNDLGLLQQLGVIPPMEQAS